MTTSSPDSAVPTAPEFSRLPMNATTEAEVWQYYATRALQFASEGYFWSGVLSTIGGVYITTYIKGSAKFYSFYITPEHRGQGLGRQLAERLGQAANLLTMRDCGIAEYLDRHNISYVMVDGVYDTPEYKAIEAFYADNRAKRSRVFLMNHIDEGLFIMYNLGASLDSMKAFCLHPLLQADVDLAAHYANAVKNFTPAAVALALEYRNQANLWLSDKVTMVDIPGVTKHLELNGAPTSGPLLEVRDMLIADKVQNYKDFIPHHRGTHERSLELDHYFQVWLKELGVDNFEEWVDAINSITRPMWSTN